MKRKVCIILACCLGVLWGVGASQADIIAHWTFNETSGLVAHDSVGGFHGVLSGSAAFVPGGVAGGAVSLTEIGAGLVNMGNVLNLANTSYTISAWINTTSKESDTIPLSKHTATEQSGYIIGINTSSGYGAENKAWFYNEWQLTTPTSIATVNNDVWQHLVGVHVENGNVSIYVDGGFQEAYADEHLPNTAGSLLFGGYNIGTTPTASYDGLLDDVQFYNTALTAGEIDYLYKNPGSAVPIPGAVWLLGSGLLGLAGWRRFKKS